MHTLYVVQTKEGEYPSRNCQDCQEQEQADGHFTISSPNCPCSEYQHYCKGLYVKIGQECIERDVRSETNMPHTISPGEAARREYLDRKNACVTNKLQPCTFVYKWQRVSVKAKDELGEETS
jgi:hypothetical protein